MPLLLLSSAQLGWADWGFKPTLTVQERFSDNISLASSNAESSLLTEIRPGFRIGSKGARGEYQVDYGLQTLIYSHDSGENSLNHQLNAVLKSELIEDHLFLDATANISQRSADLTQPTGAGNFNTTSNSVETRSLSLTPAWRSRFGNDATLDARWQLSFSDSSNGTVSGTNGSNMSVSLSSGSAFKRVPWSLTYQRQDSDGDSAASTFSSVTGTLGYQFTRKLRLSLSAGYDANDGNTSAYTQNSGNFWNAGVNWNPTSRTNLGATVGKRYNGNSYGLNFNHSTRKTVWTLNYSEQVMDSFALISSSLSGDLYGCLDDTGRLSKILPVASGATPDSSLCNGQTLIFIGPYSFPVTSLQNGFILTKSLLGIVSYKTPKSIYSLSMNNTRTEGITSGSSSRTSGVTGNWSFRLNSRLTSNLSLSTTQSQAIGSDSEDWNVAWSLTRQLSRTATGAIEARHLQRSDSSTTGGYDENSLSARVNMSF